MAEVESLQRERQQLAEENQQVRAKYKKSLQELMHILKVNKSLKECLDTQTRTLEATRIQQIADLTRAHQQQLDSYQAQLQQYKEMLAEEAHRRQALEQARGDLEQELTSTKLHVQALQARLDEANTPREELPVLEAESMRRKLVQYLQVVRQKQSLEQEAQQLKQRVRELTLQLLHEKERYRSDIFSKETEILRSKESQYEKLRTIESKYQLLESELNNYKTVERYFEEEANSIFDEDTIYNSIRQQITRINEDFNKYELESSNLLLKKREEEAERNRKIAELEKEVTRLRVYEQKLAEREKENQVEKAEAAVLRDRIKKLQSERNESIEKTHVLEALTLTDKHRVHSSISERIREFETRVKLLLQESPRDVSSNQSSLQQVVMLKGYVQELSELLKQAKRREEHLTKRNQHYKEKAATIEESYKEKIKEYKAKITNYDSLVSKLYAALQDKFRERASEEIEKEFNTAIGHYEQKMLQMSQEIIKLRARVTDLEGTHEQQATNQISALESEAQTYKEIISELSIRINELQAQRNKAQEGEDELREKDKLIDSLAKEVSELNQQMGDLREKESNTAEIVQGYQRRMVQLKEELEEKERICSNLSRNSIDTASLIEKVNYLEYELNKYRAKPDTATPRPDDFIKGLENALSTQGQQLAQYKQEIDKLYAQLKTQKSEKRTNAADHHSLIAQLQQQLTDGEIRILGLEKELHSKEVQYKEEVQTLRFQNRALIEQLNSKHSEMMGYYEELSRKTQQEESAARLPDLQRYVLELEHKNQEIIERFSYEANQLNASILALRTTNLSLRNELQNKEDTINELKHQLFNAELRTQKDKSLASSIARENESEREKERLLTVVVLLSTQVESLRVKNEELEAMYHQDLDKYREALKLLETRQMELCHSLQLSSEVHENKLESNLQLSQEEISHLSQNSTYIVDSNKPLEATLQTQIPVTFRSQQAGLRSQHWGEQARSIPSSSQVVSNVSIEASPSPLKRKGVTIKKIG